MNFNSKITYGKKDQNKVPKILSQVYMFYLHKYIYIQAYVHTYIVSICITISTISQH